MKQSGTLSKISAKKSAAVAFPKEKRTDVQTSEYKKIALTGKIMLPILSLVICLSLLAITFSWFKEINMAEYRPVTISARTITTLYFEDFERDQLDADNRFTGQTGLGIIGTPTAADAPYEAKFLMTVRVDDNTPIPVKLVLRIQSVTVQKAGEESIGLTEEQIKKNFTVKLYDPLSLEENDTAKERLSDFILVIRYFGETENVPFEFSGIEYNGAKFTFAIDMYGEVS